MNPWRFPSLAWSSYPKTDLEPSKTAKALWVTGGSVSNMAHLLDEIPSDPGGLTTMIRQTVWEFQIERTKEELTAHRGLALLAEYNHGMGLWQLADRHLPAPWQPPGLRPFRLRGEPDPDAPGWRADFGGSAGAAARRSPDEAGGPG